MWLKFFFGVLVLYFVKGDFDPFPSNPESEYEDVAPLRPQDPEGLSFRLANNTRPVHYDVWLSTAIHEADFRFNGTVHIRFRTLTPSTNITLNFKQLTITNVDLLDTNEILMQSNLLTIVDDVTELLVTYPNHELLANQQFILSIDYNGVMRTDNYGYYRGFYVDENGQQRWFGTTQFQATDARHAFPCYDEPHIRAAYTLHMRHHQSYHALGNKPIFSITPPDQFGYVITNFEEIPNMHSYLNAFTVSDFIYIENSTVRPPQRVYGRRQRINNGDGNFALEVSPAIMKTCEEYYGFNYTFPKMDQVALTMFPAGAMENWGLVNYLEIFLLFDPLISTTLNRDNIIRIIAHEFMHQWIGNIINPEWWTYLWINEGFATLDQFYLSHLTYPNDRYMDTFYVTQTQPTFITDANPNIRHMSWYVESPAAILTLFDTISYPKAGSVLHTFQNAYGYATFQMGVQYLLLDRFHQFHNSEILYANLQRAVNEDHRQGSIPNVHISMRTWEMQAGFPVVTISRSGNTLTISQERFMYDKSLHSDNLWWIPLNYVVGSNPDFSSTRTDIWMEPVRSVSINSNVAPKPWTANDWIVFNIQASSYIRVNYDSTLWQLLINQLNSANRGFERIHYRNRAQLIDDAHHLARGDRTNFSVVLGLIEYMWQEIDYVPWMAADRTFNFLTPRLSGSRVFAYYQDFIRRSVSTLFNHLGVQWIANEPRLDRFSRTIALNLACRHQLPDCLNRTNEELTANVFMGRRIEPEYRASIYCNGLRTGTALLFVSMQNRLLRTFNDQVERNNIIDGMACTHSSDLLFIHLNLAITPGVAFTNAERTRILTAPAIHGERSLISMMEFIESKFNLIIAEGPTFLPSMLNSISNNIASDALYSRFMLLMAELLCRNAITSEIFTQHLNNARTHLNWQSANLGAILEFFSERNL